MEELFWLPLILLVFHLAGCAVWVRPGGVVFRSQLTGRHLVRPLGDRVLVRRTHGGLVFANVLPTGEAFVTQVSPISLAPEGIASFVSQAIDTDERPLD